MRCRERQAFRRHPKNRPSFVHLKLKIGEENNVGVERRHPQAYQPRPSIFQDDAIAACGFQSAAQLCGLFRRRIGTDKSPVVDAPGTEVGLAYDCLAAAKLVGAFRLQLRLVKKRSVNLTVMVVSLPARSVQILAGYSKSVRNSARHENCPRVRASLSFANRRL